MVEHSEVVYVLLEKSTDTTSKNTRQDIAACRYQQLLSKQLGLKSEISIALPKILKPTL